MRGTTVGGWTTKQNQLRYALRKLKVHGLLERDGRRYAYRLGAKDLRCSFCSSTSTSVALLPTAASTTSLIQLSTKQQNRNRLSQGR